MEQIEERLAGSFAGVRNYIVAAVVTLIVGGGAYAIISQKQEEKREAALTTLYRLLQEEGEKPSGSDAALEKSFQDAAASYSGVKGTALLHFEAGLVAEKSGNYPEARQRYEALAESFPANSPYQGLILLRLAYVAEHAGDLAEAKRFLLRAEALRANPQREFVIYHLARLEEKLGEHEGASQHYQALIQEFQGTPLAQRAAERLALVPKAAANASPGAP